MVSIGDVLGWISHFPYDKTAGGWHWESTFKLVSSLMVSHKLFEPPVSSGKLFVEDAKVYSKITTKEERIILQEDITRN